MLFNILVSCNRYSCVVQDENFRKIFVGGLHYNTTEDNLKAYYQQWGEVVHVVIMRDMNTQRYFSHTFDVKSKLTYVLVLTVTSYLHMFVCLRTQRCLLMWIIFGYMTLHRMTLIQASVKQWQFTVWQLTVQQQINGRHLIRQCLIGRVNCLEFNFYIGIAGRVVLALWHLLHLHLSRNVLRRDRTLLMARRWSVSGLCHGKACSSLSQNFTSQAKRSFHFTS